MRGRGIRGGGEKMGRVEIEIKERIWRMEMEWKRDGKGG